MRKSKEEITPFFLFSFFLMKDCWLLMVFKQDWDILLKMKEKIINFLSIVKKDWKSRFMLILHVDCHVSSEHESY